MTGRLKSLISIIALCLCFIPVPINSQVLQDTTSLNLVRKNVDYIYNLQFNDARTVHSKLTGLCPEYPVVYLLNGMMTYWENYPMLYSTSSRNSFEADMKRCIRLCESSKNSVYEAEYLLANLCAKGMLLMFYADNDITREIIPIVTSSYKYLRSTFDFTSACTDMYYFTGVYNFYRDAYPKAYPVYKPLAILFPAGDFEIGLKQLQTAAQNSVLLRAESYLLLTYIYLYFENNYPAAIIYSKSLHELYPDNIQYMSIYIKNQLLIKKYDEAEKLINASSDESGNGYFQAQLTIFKGIIQEKKYFNNNLAQQLYKKGIDDISIYGLYGNEFAAYAYYGLCRISKVKGEMKNNEVYLRKALDLTKYKRINFDN